MNVHSPKVVSQSVSAEIASKVILLKPFNASNVPSGMTFYSTRQGCHPLMRIKQMKMRLKMTSVSHRMRLGKKKVGRVFF